MGHKKLWWGCNNAGPVKKMQLLTQSLGMSLGQGATQKMGVKQSVD
jgi:hypothetical protein